MCESPSCHGALYNTKFRSSLLSLGHWLTRRYKGRLGFCGRSPTSESPGWAPGFRLVPELARCLVVLSSVWVSPASFSAPVLFLVKTQRHWCGGYFILCGITKCQRVGQVFGVWSLIVRWFYFSFPLPLSPPPLSPPPSSKEEGLSLVVQVDLKLKMLLSQPPDC